jgi:hypothetical protein
MVAMRVIMVIVADLPQSYAIPTTRGMLLSKQGTPLHLVASSLLKLHQSSLVTSLHNNRCKAKNSTMTITFIIVGLVEERNLLSVAYKS